MQQIIISGQLGADAQSKEINGRIVINFNVAVNERRGESEETRWYPCALWRDKEKAGIAQYLTKGMKIIVEGKPDIETWLSKDKGEPQARIKITVRDLFFCSGGPKKTDAEIAAGTGVL